MRGMGKEVKGYQTLSCIPWPREVSSPPHWRSNSQWNLTRPKAKSSVAPLAMDKGFPTDVRWDSKHRKQVNLVSKQRDTKGCPAKWKEVCCLWKQAPCFVLSFVYVKALQGGVSGNIKFVSFVWKETIRQNIVRVKNLVSRKGVRDMKVIMQN